MINHFVRNFASDLLLSLRPYGTVTCRSLVAFATIIQFSVVPALAFDGSPAGVSEVKTAAASMLRNMKLVVGSDLSLTERQAVVHRVKKLVANMTPTEKLRLTDELIASLERAMISEPPTVRPFEMPTFIVALSGLSLLLTRHPERIVNTRPGAGLIALSQVVYVQREYLSPGNVEMHAAQLRGELFALRRTLELNEAAGNLKSAI